VDKKANTTINGVNMAKVCKNIINGANKVTKASNTINGVNKEVKKVSNTINGANMKAEITIKEMDKNKNIEDLNMVDNDTMRTTRDKKSNTKDMKNVKILLDISSKTEKPYFEIKKINNFDQNLIRLLNTFNF